MAPVYPPAETNRIVLKYLEENPSQTHLSFVYLARSGRVSSWEKVKCTRRGEFPIVGFVPASGGMIAALYLGRREKRTLLYAGKVGTGFTHDLSRMMRQKLEGITTDRPVIPKLKKPKARWVKPKFLAEVEYFEISTGLLARIDVIALPGSSRSPRRKNHDLPLIQCTCSGNSRRRLGQLLCTDGCS